jgi:hypothetical protein
VSERLRRAHMGVRGGAEPPTWGLRGSALEIFFRTERHIFGTTFYLGGFFGTWFFADGFLFPVKELGFWTNPGHWVRVLDAAGSYMYIVL